MSLLSIIIISVTLVIILRILLSMHPFRSNSGFWIGFWTYMWSTNFFRSIMAILLILTFFLVLLLIIYLINLNQ